jgi:hypothetical protein
LIVYEVFCGVYPVEIRSIANPAFCPTPLDPPEKVIEYVPGVEGAVKFCVWDTFSFVYDHTKLLTAPSALFCADKTAPRCAPSLHSESLKIPLA